MPPKGKPDTAGYQKLKKDLSAGTPGKLYILHGEETYLRDYYLGRLRELILTEGMGEFNLHEIKTKDMSPHALEEAVDCLPMMAERTLVLVTDYDLYKAGEKDRESYIRIFSQLPDYCCVVFVYDLVEYKGDARTKLAGALKQYGTVVNFIRQEQGDLVDWVRRRFRALGKDIDSRLALDLIFMCGDLMTNLVGEIEKIGAYAKQKHITRADIEAVATPQLDAVVFRMTDAIGEGNFDRAASVLGALYQMQEPPVKIMWSLGRQMRQLYSARLALEQGRGSAYVASLWGIKPYPADKLMHSARRFSLKWCRNAVIACGKTDLAMKSTGQDGGELLTTLLLQLATPAGR
jgi:DNA polymerase-3 subunit delta